MDHRSAGCPPAGPDEAPPACTPLTCGLCFSHRAGMSLCTVLYSTGISYTCRSTLSPSPSFSSSWKGEGVLWHLAGAAGLTRPQGTDWPVLRQQVGILTQCAEWEDGCVCWSSPKLLPHLPPPLFSDRISAGSSIRPQPLTLGAQL